jgi:Ger(x)C family germination protein
MLDTAVPRELNIKHMQAIVISEEVAKDGILGEFMAPLNRFSQIRKTSHVFIAKGKAINFIKENKASIGTSIAKDIKIMVDESLNTGFFPYVDFEEFYRALKSLGHEAIAPLAAVNDFNSFVEEGKAWGNDFKTGGEYSAGKLPRIGRSKIELWGPALFKGDKLVKELNGDETRFLLMAKGKFKRGSFTVQDPKNPDLIVAMDVTEEKSPDVTVKLKNLKPIIKVKVNLDGDLLAVQSMVNYEDPELKKLLEDTFKQKLKKGIEKLITECKELNIDVFSFGDYAARCFLTINEWEEYKWKNHFKDADVTVDVEFTIRRTGKQLKSNQIT